MASNFDRVKIMTNIRYVMMKAMTMMMFSQSGLPHLVTSGQRSYDDNECDGGDDELDIFFHLKKMRKIMMVVMMMMSSEAGLPLILVSAPRA